MSETAQQEAPPTLAALVAGASRQHQRAARLAAGEAIRKAREARGLGVRELAGLAEVNPGDLSAIESGSKWYQKPAEKVVAVLTEA